MSYTQLSLEEAAASQDLTPRTAGPLNRRPDGFVPGLGGAPDLMSAVFSLDLEAPTAERSFEVGSNRVFVQLLERTEPEAEEVQATLDNLKEDLLNAKRNQLVEEWVDRQRSDFEKSGELVVNSELVLSGS